MGVMLDVRCSSCDQIFQVEDDAAGSGEACPSCGAINDVPGPVADVELPSLTSAPPRPAAWGIPSPLWWLLVFAAVACFIATIWSTLHGDEWERRHLQALADADQRAAAFLVAGDFDQAGRQYQFILDTLGTRPLQSVYLRQLLITARQGLHVTQTNRWAAATAPSSQPSIPPADASQDAIQHFQRAAEAFGDFVRARPEVFQDERGNWRRRQLLVWSVQVQLQPQSPPTQIVLQYQFNARRTAAHGTPDDALADSEFLYDDRPLPTRCQTTFELRSGRWVAVQRQTDPETSDDTTMRKLEDQAFGAAGR
jgi:hypothetical protein